ncbi:MAG: hypothetical protein AAGB93_05315 [Planctomycetota bacterium]
MLLPATLLLAPFTAPFQEDLGALVRRYRASEAVEARVLALEEIAALHRGEGSDPAITRAVVDALKRKEPFEVRTRAIELLGAGLDPDAAVVALVQAARGLERDRDDLRKLSEEAPELRKDRKGNASVADTTEFLTQVSDHLEAVKERMEAMETLQSALVVALRTRRDDRCAEGLGLVGRASPRSARALDALDGLLDLGTAPAVEEALAMFRRDEEVVKAFEKQRKELERSRVTRVPKSWKGSKADWKEREDERIETALEKHDALALFSTGWIDGYAERIRAFAKAKGLDEPPSTTKSHAWKRWFKSAGKELPASVVPEKGVEGAEAEAGGGGAGTSERASLARL